MTVAVREAVSVRPEGPLRLVVARHQGYRQRRVAPARHLGLPSPHLRLIFTVDEPLTVARHPDPGQAPGSYLTLLSGLHTASAVLEHEGAQSGVQLQLSPLGARALIGVPAGELANFDVAATDLLGPLARDLQEQVQAAATWPNRFRVLDRELGRRVHPTNRPAAQVCRAWQLLRSSHGTARVAWLAAEVGWSERHLTRQFRVETGLTPKVAARVIRFDRARRALRGSGGGGAAVAAACGYTDQPHLVHDFVAFTGLSPRAWLAAEVGNSQSTGSGRGDRGAHEH